MLPRALVSASVAGPTDPSPEQPPEAAPEQPLAALPADVVVSLARGLGVVLRSVPRRELPPSVRTLATLRPKTLLQRRSEAVTALDDPVLQEKLLNWLADPPSALSSETADLLRLAAERPEGWREELAARSEGPAADEPPARASRDNLVAAERDRTKRAREEARAAREAARREVQNERTRSRQLERRARDLEKALNDVQSSTDTDRRRHADQVEELERRLRRAQRELDKATAERAELRAALKDERRKLRNATKETGGQTKRSSDDAPANRKRGPARSTEGRKAARRRPRLHAPKGRFADDPDSLEEWLTGYEVLLLVDGYNVARAPGGYGGESPEHWRQRLIDDLERYARARAIPTTIVFDGQNVAAGTPRRRRKGSPVDVQYSRPPEIADDHLVAVLEGLPPDPVIVVTDDRDLQNRVSKLGATIARSRQLLSLIRR